MPDSPTPATQEDLLIASPECRRQMCFSLPAVRALAATGTRVSVLCQEPQQAFWQAAGFHELIGYPEGSSARQIASMLKENPRALLWEAGAAADACAKAGVSERIGLPSTKLAKRLTKALERRVEAGPQEHQVRRYLDTAALLGAKPFEARFFAPIGPPTERRPGTILIAPDSDLGSHHEWPVERWKEVLEFLAGRHHELRIAITPGGQRGSELAELSGTDTVEVEPSEPLALGGFGLCLAADGTLPHLAAAVGTTCAVLFGPADPELVRPLGKQHLVIRRKVECSPCFLDKCPIDLRCQQELDAGRVIEKLRAFDPS